MKNPLIKKIDFEIKDNHELSEFNAGLMQAKKSIKSVIENHVCAWTPVDGSRFFKIGCSTNLNIGFKESKSTAYKQGEFCSYCSGRIVEASE